MQLPLKESLRCNLTGMLRGQEYCDTARSLLREALAGGPCDNMRLVCLALEHERMHQETLSYMVTQQVSSEALGVTYCTRT